MSVSDWKTIYLQMPTGSDVDRQIELLISKKKAKNPWQNRIDV